MLAPTIRATANSVLSTLPKFPDFCLPKALELIGRLVEVAIVVAVSAYALVGTIVRSILLCPRRLPLIAVNKVWKAW